MIVYINFITICVEITQKTGVQDKHGVIRILLLILTDITMVLVTLTYIHQGLLQMWAFSTISRCEKITNNSAFIARLQTSYGEVN